MPTVNAARNIMQSALVAMRDAQFAAPQLEIAHDNVHKDISDLDEYIRSTIEHQTGTRPFLGTAITRRSGIWFIQIFTAIDEDMTRSDAIAQAVLDLLRTWPVGPIRILEPALAEVGATDGAWFQVNVSATFEYDDNGQ